MLSMKAKIINVIIERDHRGVLVATSQDLSGLHVVADNLDSLNEKLPEAIELLFLARGLNVTAIESEANNHERIPPWIAIPSDRQEGALC